VVSQGTDPTASQTIRQRWHLTGQVQGVGFRPFVYRLARQHHLTGFVRNDTTGVVIEAQGAAPQIDHFACNLQAEIPPLAVIHSLRRTPMPVSSDETDFRILTSHDHAQPTAQVTVDTALCRDCLAEMLDPADRRQGYALINCTNCGPRYSIIRRIPYDRPNTTMAAFVMCDRCRAEYTHPADRRFHAQPIACHTCGPKLQLVGPQGAPLPGDPIAGAVERLAGGGIVAIKGLGGFHLAVNAADREGVARLRRLKHRDQKPFALMCASLAEARRLVELSEEAQAAMTSPACPIVLSPRRGGADVAEAVAPGNHRLGVMLPYTPIHHLLFERGRGRFAVLVMTSGNLSDEPLVIDNSEAVRRLGGMCDAILWHDRPIERCVDDSVIIEMSDGSALPVRRARGYVPAPLVIPRQAATAGLCLGGELKNTVAVVRESQVILSHHLGDLTHPLAFAAFKRAVGDLCDLFSIEPRWIAHDLHPAYLSTSYAQGLSKKLGVPAFAIQHHHAHAAAVMAEHGVTEKVLAVTCDGTGYGTDGTVWGGELLLADLGGYERLGRMRLLRLPGGDAAARDTRRCGLALLHQAFGDSFGDHPMARRLVADDAERSMLREMIRRGINCAMSSSVGRVFDGVAALLGLCSRNNHEAQAAMAMESAAARAEKGAEREDLFAIETAELVELDLSPLVREIVEGVDGGRPCEELARLFHEQLARGWEAMAAAAAHRSEVRCVALSGGVFCNQRLTEDLTMRLEGRGLRVLRHRLVPPNDGGLAYGQAAIAAARSAECRG